MTSHESRAGGEATPAVIVTGPTASGKSRLGLDLAEAFDGTVINADSMQVYRELRILTDRPGDAALARAPHRLFGILPAAGACSAGQWRGLALEAMGEAKQAGRLPILVGGTGLYLKSLLHGLAPIPDIPEPVRRAARDRHRRLGNAAFHAGLSARDPEMAARLRPADTQRLIRAWEVIEATGRSLAHWQGLSGGGAPADFRFATILLAPPRERLYAACEARFAAMLEGGAVAEVRALLALGLDGALPAMKAVGVPEIARHLAGDWSLDEAASAARQSTRRYVKRQMTWFGHQLDPDLVLEAPRAPESVGRAKEFVRRFLLTLMC